MPVVRYERQDNVAHISRRLRIVAVSALLGYTGPPSELGLDWRAERFVERAPPSQS